jgi:hypothetical protein
MAAPKFAPTSPTDVVRAYSSPDHVPDGWMPDRPAEIIGRQPEGHRLGYQGPDQGYALRLAEMCRDRVRTTGAVSVDDAIRGALVVALRRASIFGRAPVMHDLTIGFTIWGFFDDAPPADLVERRTELFSGLDKVTHHYAEARLVADLVPEATLRMTPAQAASAYPRDWRTLTGA